MALAYRVGISKAPHGRLAKGLASANIRRHALPQLLHEQRVGQAGMEAAWLEYRQRTFQARALAKEFRNLERRFDRAVARGNQTLPGQSIPSEARLTELGEQLGALYEAQDAARGRFIARRQQLVETQRTIRQMRRTMDAAQRASLPDFDQYMARMSTGMGMLGAAWVMRSSPGAEGTQWYEYRVKLPEAMGGRSVNLDFRAFAPFSQYLFVADVMEDIHKNTDWELYHRLRAGTDPDGGDPEGENLFQALREAYDGKRDLRAFRNEFLEAFLSISRAAGATLSGIDLITGKQTSKGLIQDSAEWLIGNVGQFIARGSVPLRQVNDLDYLINEDAAIARIPEEGLYGQLVQPTIANIPRLREQIPPKISSTTGEPLSTYLPPLRTLTGITMRQRHAIEVQMRELGMSFSDATPRATGDRVLDNIIATEYSKLLKRVAPKLESERIQRLPIAARREAYARIFGKLKSVAYRRAYRQLTKGVEDPAARKETRDKLARPGDVRRREYRRRTLRKLQAEAAGQPAEGELEGPPTVVEPDAEIAPEFEPGAASRRPRSGVPSWGRGRTDRE
jgi:hypothetical protein